MAFLNTIMEYEGVVAQVRPRYWAAHQQAIGEIGFQGPKEDEFWRLLKTGSSEGLMVPYGKSHHVAEYIRLRDQFLYQTAMMEMDDAFEDAAVNLRLLKEMGSIQLVTFCPNREGLNKALVKKTGQV